MYSRESIAPSSWHPLAQSLWQSVQESEHNLRWTATDWWMAWFTCEQVHTYSTASRPSAGMLKEVRQLLADLGMTEAIRNFAKVEVVRPEPEDGTHMEIMAGYLANLGIDVATLKSAAAAKAIEAE